ncbi:acyltransferase [Luteithermobacter gelatinilyticus]|uniref:acyltransferase n=1 Tax=Luteithermobacter gelatinilyticus TaxID=2582913 RepID=UPI0011074B81|nr:acyltransferase [Luteithermobacter gelatinilyticus]
MPFLSDKEVRKLGFKKIGVNVKISDRASIHDAFQIEIGDNSRIDDYCVISGKVKIGRNVHIAVFCNLAGGTEGIVMEDFSGLAYGCHVFSQSDDYSGRTMTNPTIPTEFKKEIKGAVYIGRHCILGTNSIVFPGVTLAEGTAVGASAVVTKSTDPWHIYIGNPAKKIKKRRKDLLELEKKYLTKLSHPK